MEFPSSVEESARQGSTRAGALVLLLAVFGGLKMAKGRFQAQQNFGKVPQVNPIQIVTKKKKHIMFFFFFLYTCEINTIFQKNPKINVIRFD